VILDHVGNVLRLGHHLEDREWSLAGTPKKDREAAPSVKVCPSCFAAMPSGKPKCPDCGHQFAAERRELEHVDGELQEVEFQRREQRREQSQAQTVEQLIEVGKRRGMKNPRGWARHVMAARQAKGQWAKVA
jgi:DNA repair protein RadD